MMSPQGIIIVREKNVCPSNILQAMHGHFEAADLLLK
ncbi:hypothetical protein chiPu_0025908, partial [Chiloscyllium punctatum]|nr:hypothetical protein [Chiloscyllium punctatum]